MKQKEHEEFIKEMKTLLQEYIQNASKVFDKDFVTHPGFDTTRVLRKMRDRCDDHKRFIIKHRKGTEQRRKENKDLFSFNEK